MALAPKFAGHKLSAGGAADTKHTLEVYLDYVCPFSAKMFKTLYATLPPKLTSSTAPYSRNLQLIFRQQIQPWHPSSTLTHEAALAVLKISPQHFWPFSAALFQRQTEFFDVNVVNERRNETYARLAKIAGEVGVDEGKVMGLLRISEKPGGGGELNAGNAVTGDVKQIVKAARVVGVHVSPTVFFDGIEEKSISSSFTAEQWEEWLKKNVV
ncbi:hypothetical protein AJ79_03833 [Helicocarpus griseus UAMH5409]|uniref:Thioredoxin-like fold domain-containing protein n=1 Tax=Helicocarpus griseus UAMH5409 TaxID=1447875 RepID=A0A2B7XV93_9EURO|nr:hypothetical protein AJ79_03833 [Helicocarpus griseus UAMH5409]